ncbi:UDP-N-acetylmuramoyl-L-alanyl-D-glutamate--2, 6-diaminopimelate ligase [uncultured Alphaproteobacteria bacterium]|uniref:UDP-N-acetylmuramoyl-L-alanyl-D-glutamate--2,6-diaminopimelate ligase n=1 Tax=uncultured Alphaproteobacteria bacterium TaxID=91750 RepID=A0A212JKA4_9PROT|nr:UDP-N-acetylmuramoyl-L-alanyl-D-glutamate--2, 6-diaminopimelate ligase [uncultured Alphaproteobacteria bacterium]
MDWDTLIAAACAAEPGLAVVGEAPAQVAALAIDSRDVVPGALFAALPGAKADGRDFLPQAAAAGARVALVPAGTDPARLPAGMAAIVSADPRRLIARLAAVFHAPLPAVIAAVTGTNGKTSIAEFTRQIWTRAGHAAASLGTLGAISPFGHEKGSLTTPDVVTLTRTLSGLAARGVGHACIEASSHGLDQRRLDGLALAAAAFTNLTRDHLDYHGTTDAYFTAKARLFDTLLPAGAAAVLNADIPEFAALGAIAARRGLTVVDYGANARALRLLGRAATPGGQILDLSVNGSAERVVLPLAGTFQAMNALAAFGLALSTGVSKDIALVALAHLKGAPGRLERRALRDDGAAVYVDYAHTPDALETVLTALRPHTHGHLIAVFGCGGDRDRGKRPVMGGIARRLADRVIVTDDNPRTEVAGAIRAEVLAGCPDAEEIGDRGRAIRTAMAEMRAGDVLLVAGKGHETGQIVGATVLPFDDREVVDALSREIW